MKIKQTNHLFCPICSPYGYVKEWEVNTSLYQSLQRKGNNLCLNVFMFN